MLTWMITIIKIGIPDRWEVMVRRIAAEELTARCTSVPTAHIPQIGKITWQNIFVLIQERNHLPVKTVPIVQPQKTNWYSICELIPEKGHLLVPIVHIVQLKRTNCISTYVSTLERNPSLVHIAHSDHPPKIPWIIISESTLGKNHIHAHSAHIELHKGQHCYAIWQDIKSNLFISFPLSSPFFGPFYKERAVKLQIV